MNMLEKNSIKVDNISVFFLCYNDESTIGALVEEAIKVLQNISGDFEVIVVDDGSVDNSRSVLEELKNKYGARFRPVYHGSNKGYGAAIKTGFKSCKNDLVFYTDGDGQYDISEIVKLLRAIDGADMVNGYLCHRSDPFYRIALGKIYQTLLRLILCININYVDCDFRLFRRHVIDSIKLDSNGGFICAEMMKRISERGYKIKEVAVHHYARKSGRSQFFNIRNVSKLVSEFVAFCAKEVFNNNGRI